MDILYLLIPLSLVFVFLIAIVFWWNLRSGQFEDLEGPGYRILMDDDRPENVEVRGTEASAPGTESSAGGGSRPGNA